MRRLIAISAAGILASGCLVSSLQPVYDDNSIVFDELLIGTWEIRESEVTVVISRGEWRSYHVIFNDRFGTSRYTGHMTAIGASRFLNVRPEDGLERAPFLIATNGMLNIEVERDRVRVREPDYATVFKRVAAGTLGLAAAIDLKKNVLLTASSQEVRAWLLTSLKDPAWFAEWKTFTRRSR